MRSGIRFLSAVMIAGAVASPIAVVGCSAHRHYYNGGSGAWNDNESPYYARWEQETRREHREWAQRNADEQREYWSWRHDHP